MIVQCLINDDELRILKSPAREIFFEGEGGGGLTPSPLRLPPPHLSVYLRLNDAEKIIGFYFEIVVKF